MPHLGPAWRAAMGQPTSRELAEARRGFSRRDVRRIRRAMRSGDSLQAPADARLAVALAREQAHQDRLNKRWLLWFFGAIVILWALTAVDSAADGRTGVALVFTISATYGAWLLWVLPRWRRNARATIETHPDVPDPVPGFAALSGGERALGLVLTLTFYVIAFGLLKLAMEGEELTAGGVLVRGLFFGVAMTLANQLWLRRRYERG